MNDNEICHQVKPHHFISPHNDRELRLRRHVKLIQEIGETGTHNENGKVKENKTGDREMVLFQFPRLQ
jgi:hypothetical protein